MRAVKHPTRRYSQEEWETQNPGPALLSGYLTENEIAELRQVFDEIDDDGSGAIDKDELGSLMRSVGQNPSEEELGLFMAQIDTSGSGEIEWDEFLSAVQRIKAASQEYSTNVQQQERNAGALRNDILVGMRRGLMSSTTHATELFAEAALLTSRAIITKSAKDFFQTESERATDRMRIALQANFQTLIDEIESLLRGEDKRRKVAVKQSRFKSFVEAVEVVLSKRREVSEQKATAQRKVKALIEEVQAREKELEQVKEEQRTLLEGNKGAQEIIERMQKQENMMKLQMEDLERESTEAIKLLNEQIGQVRREKEEESSLHMWEIGEMRASTDRDIAALCGAHTVEVQELRKRSEEAVAALEDKLHAEAFIAKGLREELTAVTDKFTEISAEYDRLSKAHEMLSGARNAYNAVITDKYIPNILDEEALQQRAEGVHLMAQKYDTVVTMLRAERAAARHLHAWNQRKVLNRLEKMLEIETSEFMKTLEAENNFLRQQAARLYDMVTALGGDPPLERQAILRFCHHLESPIVSMGKQLAHAHRSLHRELPARSKSPGGRQGKQGSQQSGNEERRREARHNFYDEYYSPAPAPAPAPPPRRRNNTGKKKARPQSARPNSARGRTFAKRSFSSMTIVASHSRSVSC